MKSGPVRNCKARDCIETVAALTITAQMDIDEIGTRVMQSLSTHSFTVLEPASDRIKDLSETMIEIKRLINAYGIEMHKTKWGELIS